MWYMLVMDCSGNKCLTQRQRSEVDHVAVGAIAPFISSSDLEGIYRAGNQRVDGHSVGLTVHARCTVYIWTLRGAQGQFVKVTLGGLDALNNCVRENIHWVYLVIVSKLVLKDVSVGPIWLRPWQSDGVWGSAQLVHHGNCTGNCGRANRCMSWTEVSSISY